MEPRNGLCNCSCGYMAPMSLTWQSCSSRVGGIYITGGIGAKIQQWMRSADFIGAYFNKGRMRQLVERTAVFLVTNERVGMIGAMAEAVKIRQVE